MNSIRAKIGEGGRVIIPSAFRQHLHLKIGDEIIMHLKDEEIYITTPYHALKQLQTRVKNYSNASGSSFSLVDDLIQSRRVEAGKENER